MAGYDRSQSSLFIRVILRPLRIIRRVPSPVKPPTFCRLCLIAWKSRFSVVAGLDRPSPSFLRADAKDLDARGRARPW